MNSEEKPEVVGNHDTSIVRMFRSPKLILGATLIYVGILMPMVLKDESDIFLVLKEKFPLWGGVLVAIIGMSLALSEMNKIKRQRREDKFIDIDKERSPEKSEIQWHILNEIRDLKKRSPELSAERIEEILKESQAVRYHKDEAIFDDFESYFDSIRLTLLEQAYTADKKASILLDKGTAYSKGGITFFISSIAIWQILSWVTGFQEQYIYGIVSCSVLFIFIEFLAAWFLKQYRHFVDTSTYLIKVKSIFDKYMLCYLTIKSLGSESDNVESKYQALLKVLEDDIKWPDSYLLKNGDVSFAKEAMETMTHFAKAMKSEAKSQSK